MSGIATAAIGGAVISGVMGNKAASKQAAATRDAAAMADPFAPNRQGYAGILNSLYGPMMGGGAQPTGGGQSEGWLGKFGGQQSIINKIVGGINGEDQLVTAQGDAQTNPTGTGPTSIQDFIQSSPDYQFRFNEGQRALERSFAGKGMRRSGGLLRALVDYGQGKAAGAYESEINRIMTMAGATMGSPGVAGQLASQAAATQAAGTNQMMGSIGYGINQGINAYMNRPLQTAPAGAIGSTPSWYGTGGMGTIT